MSRCLRSLAVFALRRSAATRRAQAAHESAPSPFGGFRLARITNDFVGRMQKHPRIGSFFKDGYRAPAGDAGRSVLRRPRRWLQIFRQVNAQGP